LKFFVKDPIDWGNYSMTGFYKTLLNLRRSTPALAADASYRRLKSTNDDAVFSYIREKSGRKVVVVLNMSPKEQKFSIKDKAINGNPMNVFLMQNEKLSDTHEFSIEPWGFIIYNYR
jgi:glycosidase